MALFLHKETDQHMSKMQNYSIDRPMGLEVYQEYEAKASDNIDRGEGTALEKIANNLHRCVIGWHAILEIKFSEGTVFYCRTCHDEMLCENSLVNHLLSKDHALKFLVGI